MRLTCPNCGAEYDVPEGLVPPDGRHVQCTACHTRWFMRGRAREELSEDQILRKLETRGERPRPVDPPSEGDAPAPIPFPMATAPEPEAPPARDAEPMRELVEARGSSGDEAHSEAASAEKAPEPAEAVLPAPRPALDLRPAPPAPARLSAEAPAPRPAEEPEPRLPALREAPRGASTRPRIDVADAQATPPIPARPRRRFLPGFILALLLAGLALEIYVWRDPLAAQVPAAAPAIHGYADAVDAAREWLRDRGEAMGLTREEAGATPETAPQN